MPTIPEALATVKQRLAEAAQRFNRSPTAIQLLAVSKTRSVTEIVTAIHSGQHCFGENYVQEAVPKIQALHDYKVEWHFIGPVQTNKTRLLAEHFAWVQSLDSLKQAQRLNAQRPPHLPPLNVCIQVNVSAEPQKAGIIAEDLLPLATAIAELPRLRLRGLMTIPAYHPDFEAQRVPFRTLFANYCQLQQAGFAVDTLSMGMTEDMVAAIAEGSTLVRIGTGIFGERV